jgi:hypothetical protein
MKVVNVDSENLYQAQWEEYRIHWRNYWLAFFGFFPAVLLFSFAAGLLSLTATTFGIDIIFVGVILWFPVYALFTWRLTRWSCPHYHGIFHRPLGFFGVACANCGMRKYAGSDFDRGWSSRLRSRELPKDRTQPRSAGDPKL